MPQTTGSPDPDALEGVFEIVERLREERESLLTRLRKIEGFFSRLTSATRQPIAAQLAAAAATTTPQTAPIVAEPGDASPRRGPRPSETSMASRAMQIFTTNPYESFTTASLAVLLGVKLKSLRTTLKHLVDDGKITRVRNGVFHLATVPTQHATPQGFAEGA